MKALVWEGPKTLIMREQAPPIISVDELLIRVRHVGICGSELSGYLGHNALRTPPLIMGHEFSGEIVALGDRVHEIDKQLTMGKLVTVNPLDYCGECNYCQRSLNQHCVNRRLLGAHRSGGFAEYISVPAKLASILPDGIDTKVASLTEPVACAVRIAELAGNVRGQQCLVIGAGSIGLLTMQTLMLNGASQVFLSEIDPHRLVMAKELGAETINPREVDVPTYIRERTDRAGVAIAVDAVGSALTREQCVKALQSMGKLILSGLHEEKSAMPAADIIRREISVKGSFAYSPDNFAQALQLLTDNRVGLGSWIIEAPLEEGGQWFDRLIEKPGNVSKVLLVP